MPARTTRQAARERMQAVLGAALDRLIPPDEAVPLKGALFVDFEDQVEALVRAVERSVFWLTTLTLKLT
jgi:hypothetical protein